MAGLSDLIKINSGVTDLAHIFSVKSLSSPGVEKTRSSNQSTSRKIQPAPAISPLTHLSKFHNPPLHPPPPSCLFVITLVAISGSYTRRPMVLYMLKSRNSMGRPKRLIRAFTQISCCNLKVNYWLTVA